MRLKNLINNCKAQTCATGEAGLERLKQSARFGGIEANSSVANGNARPGRICVKRDGENSTVGHGTQRVVAEIPENLLQSIPVGAGTNIASCKLAFDPEFTESARVSLDQGESLFDNRRDIDFHKGIGLFAGVIQENR